ncbi:hypothetical protein D3C78_1600140 [compost metagenome]
MLGHRGRAVGLAVAHGDALGAGGGEVDVVGAGGGHQDQLELRVGGHGGGVDAHLVADGHLGTAQALGHLVGGGLRVQLQFVEGLAQRRQVEVAEVEGGMVEKDGAAAVHAGLYLFLVLSKA